MHSPAQLQVSPWERATQAQRMGAMLLGGGFAGAFSWIFTLPVDQVKTLVQSQKLPCAAAAGEQQQQVASVRKLVRQQTSNEGLGAFFRGMGPTLSRAFVVNAVTFCVFETVLNEIGGEMSGGGAFDVEETERV